MYPLDRNVIVTAIFLTTLLSVVTIPLWILLLQG
jgi:predicted permease